MHYGGKATVSRISWHGDLTSLIASPLTYFRVASFFLPGHLPPGLPSRTETCSTTLNMTLKPLFLLLDPRVVDFMQRWHEELSNKRGVAVKCQQCHTVECLKLTDGKEKLVHMYEYLVL